MKVERPKDTFEIPDGELQQVLKAYIERETGRKVCGQVHINVHERHSVVDREEFYFAVGTLEDKS
jgi:hypothetical protein